MFFIVSELQGKQLGYLSDSEHRCGMDLLNILKEQSVPPKLLLLPHAQVEEKHQPPRAPREERHQPPHNRKDYSKAVSKGNKQHSNQINNQINNQKISKPTQHRTSNVGDLSIRIDEVIKNHNFSGSHDNGKGSHIAVIMDSNRRDINFEKLRCAH